MNFTTIMSPGSGVVTVRFVACGNTSKAARQIPWQKAWI